MPWIMNFKNGVLTLSEIFIPRLKGTVQGVRVGCSNTVRGFQIGASVFSGRWLGNHLTPRLSTAFVLSFNINF